MTDYLLQGDDEGRRLMRQAAYLAPHTLRALRAAGIGPGSRVLDLGCGMGDVALLSAELGATVVSIERDPAVAAAARERLGTRVEVVVGDIADANVAGPFDAITGRLIMMYVRDPAAVLRDLVARVLRPGGAVAIVEYDFRSTLMLPGASLLRETIATVCKIIAAAGFHGDLGLRLPDVFVAAGLPLPQLEAHLWTSVGDDLAPEMATAVLRNTLPLGEKLGITKASDFDLATLPARMRADRADGIGVGPLVVSAVARSA
ncbi:MAG: methyltransferase domain-containing protein [Burkholderia sp.]|nr:methyltransferase domain-containing protein [Burkholderia sp.]